MSDWKKTVNSFGGIAYFDEDRRNTKEVWLVDMRKATLFGRAKTSIALRDMGFKIEPNIDTKTKKFVKGGLVVILSHNIHYLERHVELA